MTNNITELAFILDRSGSMSGLESDTIGGYNAFLKKQIETEGEAFITTALFDDRYELVHDRANIKAVSPLTDKEYFVRGSTALLDAVGATIQKLENAHKHMADAYKPSKVIIVITTDGMENASSRFTQSDIKRMIEQKRESCTWEFVFLGANIDAVQTAASYGIRRENAANYHADAEGTQLNFETLSESISTMRTSKLAGAMMPKAWKNAIDKDYKARKR